MMSSVSLPWRPLLSGETAARAVAAAMDIAAATARGAAHHPDNLGPEQVPVWENALGSGRVGQCLLHAYLALHGAGAGYADTAIDLLDKATEAAAGLPMGASLFLGFPGIAWTAAHLTGRLFVQEEDGNREVDEILLRSLSEPSWQGTYDLFTGLVGLGVYALERLPRPSATQCLEAVIAHLAKRAERHPEGAAIFTPVDTLPPQFRDQFPEGAYVLGMAQGMAGVIALLGAACHAGLATREARSLLAAMVAWMLAHERPPDSGPRFPEYYFPGVGPGHSRLAWRLGDLGIAASLLMAARGAGQPAWLAAGRRVALAAGARRPAMADGSGAGLSDGPAGIGHVFNRLYQATGDMALAEAAHFWLDRALAEREPGLGIAGFRVTYRGARLDEPGFVRGATGIGLALLAGASHVDPTWDRALLLS